MLGRSCLCLCRIDRLSCIAPTRTSRIYCSRHFGVIVALVECRCHQTVVRSFHRFELGLIGKGMKRINKMTGAVNGAAQPHDMERSFPPDGITLIRWRPRLSCHQHYRHRHRHRHRRQPEWHHSIPPSHSSDHAMTGIAERASDEGNGGKEHGRDYWKRKWMANQSKHD